MPLLAPPDEVCQVRHCASPWTKGNRSQIFVCGRQSFSSSTHKNSLYSYLYRAIYCQIIWQINQLFNFYLSRCYERWFGRSVDVRARQELFTVLVIMIFVPAERSSWGDYETGSVRVCVCVCVCPSVRPSGLKMFKFASLSFLGRFWFCFFYLIGLGGGFKTSIYTEFWNSLIMQIYANLFKKNATSIFLGRFWFCLFIW